MTYKKKAKEILSNYDRQIKKDMDFWIKYRPSRWGDLLPEKPLGPLFTFIKTKRGKKLVLILALVFSLLIFGVFQLEILFGQISSVYG